MYTVSSNHKLEKTRFFDPKVFVSCIKKETITRQFIAIKECMTYVGHYNIETRIRHET